ncbi:toxic anion resistance protein, partial [Streptococcus suis]
MADTFNFDIDKIAENAITTTDKTTDIITSTDTSETGQISFFDKLTPEQQNAITQKAPALVDNFLADQNALLDFGQSAVEAVNNTV